MDSLEQRRVFNLSNIETSLQMLHFDGIPSAEGLNRNGYSQAQYSVACQEGNLWSTSQ